MKDTPEHNANDQLDAMIRDALQSSDSDVTQFYSSDPTIFQLVGDTLRGKLRWLVWMSLMMSLAYFAFAIVCAYQLFHVEGEREMLLWFSGMIISFIAIGLIKIWYWMEMARRSTVREIKRVELQIAWLSTAVSELRNH